ncbi:hypothetical protein MesoLj113c_28160 [Mesorhizobium sp. 113-3-9]|uniref:DUF1330 domain-containing protein n=1 Tax=Mesorhizobium sp. 113-3-9 TaxID=2744517 RepID=UPI001925DF3F|nr:DUF1330 domain-containing protein [Mesorhizobium sp. 113-3-9]BCG86706.1 hypothetical protein MesoLj113c_28160 [Mesorhizobium sp. 113-3-9]
MDTKPKGYWIARVDVQDAEQYKKYVEANTAAFRKFGGVCLARGGRVQVMEGSGRSRNVIWEFPSFEAAVSCYESEEYQYARSFREGIAEADFIMVEGLRDAPWKPA